MLGIGIDIIKIDRLNKWYDLLGQKILASEELLQYNQLPQNQKQVFVATRFACKEAVLKSFQVGIGSIKFKDILLVKNPSGAPEIAYKDHKFITSISHDGGLAVVVVIRLS